MKRLICCFDGTWNDDKNEETLTNVVKLFRAIPARAPDGMEQRARYVIGIATGYHGRARFSIGASGVEVDDRIRTGYKFLVDNYQPGDEIYLFGFSRGAFQARSLAGFIDLVGIANPGSELALKEAWRLYRNRHTRTDDGRLQRLRTATHYPARIKCVGVWDTVGNLGNPLFSRGPVGKILRFHDTRLSPIIDVALHALSIDDKRGPFSPTLWTLPKGHAPPAGQHVEQVWFAGSHADVGGGYKEAGLSDIGLLWMAERIAATTPLAIDLDHLRRTTRPDPLALQHSSTTGAIFRWSALCPYIRLINQELRAIRLVRRMTLGTWRTSKTRRGMVPVNETIHDSVLQRFEKPILEQAGEASREIVYRPRNLAAALRKRNQPKH